MSSPTPRQSVDPFASPTSASTPREFPFPQPEFPQRPPSSHRHPSRRGSTASSTTSIGGVLDTSQPRSSSIAESGQNAISTLLQPPIVRTGLLPHTALPSTGGYKPPSSRDIPPVALTNIPHVDAEAFQPYLAQVGSLYDAFQRAKEEEGESQLFRRNKVTTKADDAESLLQSRLERRQSSIPSHSRSGSISSLVGTPIEAPKPTTTRRVSGGQRRVHAVTPLSTIPAVYFEEDFHLENPRTFDIVSERSEVVRPVPKTPVLEGGASNGNVPAPKTSSGRKALATNAILQEKLSWYMDTVEIHLISSISTASKSFFSALGSLRDLHSEAAGSVKKIQSIRGDLSKLDKELAMGGLKVVNLQRRRENVRRLGEAVAQLRRVVEAVSRCEDMVENGQIEQAMDGLDDVEKLIAGEEVPQPRKIDHADSKDEVPKDQVRLMDLRGIKALQGASADLDQLRWRIGKAFEGRFLNVLLGDLREHVQSVPPEATIRRWGIALLRARGEHRRAPSALPAYLNLDNQFRMKLRHDWNGLARSNQSMGAATAFRTAILQEIKSLIRKHLPSSSDDDNDSMMSASTHGGGVRKSQQEKSAILARNLRALEPEDAESMLTKIYAGVGEAFRRLSMQVKVLLDITSGVGSPPGSATLRSPPKSPNLQNMDSFLRPEAPVPFRPVPAINVQEDVQQILDMSNLLGQGVDVAQTQITKILKVRSEQTHRLSLDLFLRYFTLNRLFADECEGVSGRGGTALKSVVDGQIKDYVSSFGDMQRHHIVQVMDADKWDAKDFGDEDNKTLSRVMDGSTHDSAAWIKTTIIWTAEGQVIQSGPDTNGTANNGDQSGREKIRMAVVDEQKYILPESAMAILRSIEEFQHLMTGIPSMSQEIAACLLECLKLFNSRSSQLILGAGATRSAGLKNITTKHLALASQALSFIIAIIPYVREFVRRHSTTSSNVTTDFDKVKRLYQEHQYGIHEKLVDIMSSRATTHVNALKKIDWNTSPASSAVNPYMETLTKETSTLQKVLAKHLPEMSVQMILDPVFASYKEQLNKAYAEVPLMNETAKQRMISDVEFFKSKLGKFNGAIELGDNLIQLIRNKPIAEPPRASTDSQSQAKPSTDTTRTRDAEK